MSDLIVIGYNDEETAKTVLNDLTAMEKDYLVDLEDAAVVSRSKNGHLHVTTQQAYVGTGTLTGMFWGLLVGILFLQPWAGLALGGLAGLVVRRCGRPRDGSEVQERGRLARAAGQFGAHGRCSQGDAGQGARGPEQVRGHRAPDLAHPRRRGQARRVAA